MGAEHGAAPEQKKGSVGLDLSSLSSMLQARWKGSGAAAAAQPEAVRVGQVRSFRIVKLDREAKIIELTLA
jgi:small subunit ribosomal protein S1